MRVAREIHSGSPERVRPLRTSGSASINRSRSRCSSALLSAFRVDDRPGIIAELAGILATKQIGLEAVLQLPCDTKNDLPFVITVETIVRAGHSAKP